MTKQQAKKWIEQKAEKYKQTLFLSGYNLNVEYKNTNDSIMRARPTFPYKEMCLEFGDEMINEIRTNKKQAERIVLHEVVHTLTDPLYIKGTRRFISDQEIEDEREALTDKITMILYPLV
jgi:hypothetical protein